MSYGPRVNQVGSSHHHLDVGYGGKSIFLYNPRYGYQSQCSVFRGNGGQPGHVRGHGGQAGSKVNFLSTMLKVRS